MTQIKALYDGWPLIYQPSSPAASHLLTLLNSLPAEVDPILALPDQAPAWLNTPASCEIVATANNEKAHRKWEQSSLGKMAHTIGADLIHTTSFTAPLGVRIPVLVSPCGYPNQEIQKRDWQARLRQAQGRAGLAQAAGALWPQDIPIPTELSNAQPLPATVHPGFAAIGIAEQEAPTIPNFEMPETYTLYHGPGNDFSLRSLLKAWTWAQGPIGEYYPLLLVGLNSEAMQIANKLLGEFDLKDNVRIMPDLEPDQLVAVYQNCNAVFHTANASAWGGAIRLGLACGRPVVAFEYPDVDALAGPAAFLVPQADLRAFGAAMISTVIKESIYEPLSEKAIVRSNPWRKNDFGKDLLTVYQNVI